MDTIRKIEIIVLLCFVILGAVACGNDEVSSRKDRSDSQPKNSEQSIGASSPEEAIQRMLQAYQNKDAVAFDSLFLRIGKKEFDAACSGLLDFYYQQTGDHELEETDLWHDRFTGNNWGWNLSKEKLTNSNARLECIKNAMETTYENRPFPEDGIADFVAVEMLNETLDGNYEWDGAAYTTYKNLMSHKEELAGLPGGGMWPSLYELFGFYQEMVEKAYDVQVDDIAWFMDVFVRDDETFYSTPLNDEIVLFCINGKWYFEWTVLVLGY